MPSLTEAAVDADILSDWKQIREGEDADPTPEAPDPAPEAPEPEAEVETPVERARDDAGRFKEGKQVAARTAPLAAKPDAAPAPAAKPGADPAADPAPDAAVPPIAARGPRDTTRAPSTWSPKERAGWEKLPQEVRDAVHRRESDYLNGQSQLLPDAKLGQSLRGVIEPYRMMIESSGSDTPNTVGSLLRTAAVLRFGSGEQKLAAIRGIAHDFGINLQGLTPPADGTPPAAAAPTQDPSQFRDPRVDAMLAQQHQQDEQSRTDAATSWMNEANPQGQPLRPFVMDVMAEMKALVPQIRQLSPGLSHTQVLQEAYDRAVRANPETYALLQQDEQAKLAERQRTENQQRVQAARLATSTNVPRRGSVPAPAKPGSLEDTIREGARALGLLES